MKRIGVFCGSSSGRRPAYTGLAELLGKALAERELGLVYGGGRVGLMGSVARAVLDAGGSVTGVIPESLVRKEVAFEELSDLRVVDSMQERKTLMAELSDAFVALPGGYGTLDELVEMLTWTQLGFHDKPSGLLNTEGYFDKLLQFFDDNVQEGFLPAAHRTMLLVEEDPKTLLDRLASSEPPTVDKAQWTLDGG